MFLRQFRGVHFAAGKPLFGILLQPNFPHHVSTNQFDVDYVRVYQRP